MRWRNTPEDEATKAALARALGLVILPGLIAVFTLIYAVSPKAPPPPAQSWADGIYVNACCSPLILKGGVLKTGTQVLHYVVDNGKFGHQITVNHGIRIDDHKVSIGRDAMFVYFNRNSMAVPAFDEARSMHLWGLDDGMDYVFVKQ